MKQQTPARCTATSATRALLAEPVRRPAHPARGRRAPERHAALRRTIPKTSGARSDCRAHEVDNLYVVDGSFFPSSGAVNPALTIIANALRVGDHLIDRLGLSVARTRGGGAMTRRTLFLLCVAIATLRDRRFRAACRRSRQEGQRSGAVALTTPDSPSSDMDRSVEFYTRVLSFTKVSDVEVSGRDYELLSGVFGASAPSRAPDARRRADRADRVPRAAWTSDPAGRPQQRSQLPARRHHRQRHGEGVRTVETSRCCAGIDRAAASP